MDIEKTIEKIINEKGLTRKEIKEKIDAQIKELSGLIDEEGAILIVAKNLGVDVNSNQQAANMEKDQPINQLKPRMNASIVGRIVQIGDSVKFSRNDGSEGILLPFVIEDKTGMIRCTAWGAHHVKIKESPNFAVNEVIRIINGFAKIGRTGQLEINIGTRSALQLQPDQVDQTMIPSARTKEDLKTTKIGDLDLSTPFFNIEGTLANVYEPKTFTRKDGSLGKRASLNLIDKTGSVYITFWGDHCEKMKEVKVGEFVKITNLSPKKNYKDPNKIDLTASTSTKLFKIKDSSEISKSGEIEITPIKKFLENGGFGNLEGQVQSIVEKRTVNLRDGSQKDLMKFSIADESGAILVTLWGNQIKEDLEPGQSLEIKGVSVKRNNFSKLMEANLTRIGEIKEIKKEFNTTHTVKPIQSKQIATKPSERKSIEEINEDGYISFKGSLITEIKRVTTYTACSKCNKKLDNCSCANPGDSVERMILNVILDDGTSTIRGTLMGEKAENFLGIEAEKAVILKQNGEFDSYLQKKNTELLGNEYIFRGRAKYSDYSDSYEVNINTYSPLDPKVEAKYLLNEIKEI